MYLGFIICYFVFRSGDEGTMHKPTRYKYMAGQDSQYHHNSSSTQSSTFNSGKFRDREQI